MRLDATRLNRTTLLRQGLVQRDPSDAIGAIEKFGPLQSQNPMSPYIALWNRLPGFDPADLDSGYFSGELVKASLIRLTLHTIGRDDHTTYRSAMLPNLRGAGYRDRRFTDTGISVNTADDLTDHLQSFLTEPRTRTDIETELTDRLGAKPPPGLWRALRYAAPWQHHPGPHPWAFADPARFVAANPTLIDRDDAVVHVVRRYLTAFGPATRRDIGQYTMLRLAVVDAALARIDDLVSYDGPDGNTVDLADQPIADEVRPPPRLLGMWDNTLLAYADRSRVLPDEYRPHVIRRNGDVLPAVLLDGRVAGLWRPTDGGIELNLFDPVATSQRDELDHEAQQLAAFVNQRDPQSYRRHDHWWDKLPTAQRQTIAAN